MTHGPPPVVTHGPPLPEKTPAPCIRPAFSLISPPPPTPMPITPPPVAAATPAAIRRATLIGACAIVLWATLALLTTLAGTIPPFQLMAMAFALAFAVGMAGSLVRGHSPWRALIQPLPVWGLGVGGLFGYHFLYFLALRWAPPLEANLLNYLWPLLIVLFSALLPGERLGRGHIGGALCGLAGTALLISGGGSLEIRWDAAPGYLAAIAAAVIWAAYSVLSRRFGQVPTDAVGGFCLATALLAGLAHAAFETTVWPASPTTWLAILGLGLGPVGGAFFVWDHGVKHGDIRALGAMAYLTPLLSTATLMMSGQAAGSRLIWLACGLIVAGAILASHTTLKTHPPPQATP